MYIGIFGGAFNPPHMGHLIIAERIREFAGFDQVWWLPTPNPPHKHIGSSISFEERIHLCKLATAGNAHFIVSDIESTLPDKSYTVKTLQALYKKYPSYKFDLIIGGDSFQNFGKWYKPEHILKQSNLFVYLRPNTNLDSISYSFLAKATIVDAPLIDISSTEIRERIASNKTIRYLVPEAVQNYIQTNNLYLD